jgi:hypothetical protein
MEDVMGKKRQQRKISLTDNLEFGTRIDKAVFIFCYALEHARVSHVEV